MIAITVHRIRSLLIFVYLASFAAETQAALQLAIISPRGATETLERWNRLAEHLAVSLGEAVSIVPLSPECQGCLLTGGEIDIVLTHAVHTVAILEEFEGRVIATIDSGAGPQFGGVIITRRNTGIRTLRDLKGKRVGSMKINESAGAYIFQIYELYKIGLDAREDLASIYEGATQDELVFAVTTGNVDAAFVRSGLLESMEKEGRIKKSDFVIVNERKEHGFPFLLSTDLYPEWFITVLPHIPEKKLAILRTALLTIPPADPVVTSAKIKRFVAPVSLDKVEEVMKALKISPFD